MCFGVYKKQVISDEYFIITFKLAYIHYHFYIDQTDGEQDLGGVVKLRPI